MNILILNWRDIKNPKSGGAEILTHELARRMVRMGHTVTQFSAEFPNSKLSEKIDGVNFIRKGHPDLRFLFSSVHFEAFKYYRKNKSKYDLIIDEVHGIPFFTPLYVKKKKVALICEVAGDIWDIVFKFPFNYLGKFIEKIYPHFYKDIKIVTISNSSKEALIDLGFNRSQVHVIPLGCSVPLIKGSGKKNTTSTLIFVSRITKTKGIEDAIRALKLVKNKFPKVKLQIIGRGDLNYISLLKKLVAKIDLENNVEFKGFVEEKEKWELLEKAHILLAPSSKEGWGLTIHEAGSRGTPSIGYDVEGLRDVIVNNLNGVLCKKNNYKELAKNIIMVMEDKKLYKNLSIGALSERRRFTWDRTAKEFVSII